MPDLDALPTHVLTKDAVRWAIDVLGDRRIHPAFIYYLYLRALSVDGRLDEASASAAEVVSLVDMPGGPPSRPYYRPLRERGNRTGVLLRTFWMQPNLAGSWSPKSLQRQRPARWLVNAAADGYVLPADHAARAHDELLFGEPVSVFAMAGYFLRNDGFILDGDGGPDDVVEGFQRKFRFEFAAGHSNDYYTLFDTQEPEVGFEWFEPARGFTLDLLSDLRIEGSGGEG